MADRHLVAYFISNVVVVEIRGKGQKNCRPNERTKYPFMTTNLLQGGEGGGSSECFPLTCRRQYPIWNKHCLPNGLQEGDLMLVFMRGL